MRIWFHVTIAFALSMPSYAAESVPRRLDIGVVAPALNVKLLGRGRAPSMMRMRGNVVVLDFWATWCAPCVASIPHMNELQEQFRHSPVQFLSITYEPAGKARAFLAQHPMKTTVAVDNDLSTFQSYIAWGIPMAYIIGRDGKVAAVVNPKHITAEVLSDVLAGKQPDVAQHPGWEDPVGAAKYFREQLEKDREKY